MVLYCGVVNECGEGVEILEVQFETWPWQWANRINIGPTTASASASLEVKWQVKT